MANGILQRFPDITALVQTGATISASTGGLSGALSGLQQGGENSPLGPVLRVFGDLSGKLDIDVNGLTTDLPRALSTMQNALPPGALEYVQTIEHGYALAQEFLQNSPLVKQIPAGGDLKTVALAVIQEALQLFEDHLAGLAGKIVDPATLQRLQEVYARIEALESDFAAHQADLLPFLTDNLLGVAPDLLQAPLAHVHSALLAPLQGEALPDPLAAARRALGPAFSSLAAAVDALDPNDAAGYASLQAGIDAFAPLIQALSAALASFYAPLQPVIEGHAWDLIFPTYTRLIQAVTLPSGLSLDSVVADMADALNDILAQFYLVFSIDDVTARAEQLTRSLSDLFAGSPVGQIRQVMLGFLDQIRQAIEGVPTGQIQAAVESMLGRVREELDKLHIADVIAKIQNALADAEKFVTDNINSTLTGTVKNTLIDLVKQVQDLPIADLTTLLTNALSQLSDLIKQLEDAVKGEIDQLNQFLAQLDSLSFKPVSDAVIGEIDQVKQRLQDINPNSLSDVEKLAIKAALAVLESIDLENKTIKVLKAGYHEAEGQVAGLLDTVTAALEQLKQRFGAFDADALYKPIGDALGQAAQIAGKLNGRLLLGPLYQQLDALVAGLQGLDPGRLLDPLVGPYGALLALVNKLDPAQLIAPLNALYDEINHLIDLVDITPVFDLLDQREKELFASARKTIIDAIESLHLPAPLDSFYAAIKPLLEGLTDAIFGDPAQELKRLSQDAGASLQLGTLFAPLDDVFDRLLTMLDTIPRDAVVETMNTLRLTLGAGLDALDPRDILGQLRAAQARLAELSPALLLGLPLSLPGLKLAFQAKVAVAPDTRHGDIVAVNARFDAVFAPIDISRAGNALQPLIQAHQALMTALQTRVAGLNIGAATDAYAGLRANLDPLVPDFLRSPEPLSYDDILAGLHAIRPSARLAPVQSVFERFLARLQAVAASFEPALAGLFATIRDTLTLISPLALKGAVADIYTAIRGKIRILDPQALAGAIRTNVFDPLTAPLRAIDPAALKLLIDGAFQRVLAAVRDAVKGVLDDLAQAIDEQLKAIRQQLQAVLDAIKQAVADGLQSIREIIDRVDKLVFVEILDRLKRVLKNLGLSFDKELDRVRNAFDEMLAAIPLDGQSQGVSTSASA